eukprot:1140512-Rhodomonas_salina.1
MQSRPMLSAAAGTGRCEEGSASCAASAAVARTDTRSLRAVTGSLPRTARARSRPSTSPSLLAPSHPTQHAQCSQVSRSSQSLRPRLRMPVHPAA